MELHVKTFDELTTLELYEILRVRVTVFVVEQKCPYLETDGEDVAALHVYYEENGEIAAYLRVFPGKQEGEAHIGRVLTVRRGDGYGAKVLKEGIRAARERLHAARIVLEAQTYARGFYEREGFKQTGGEFLEDDIPHIRMELEL